MAVTRQAAALKEIEGRPATRGVLAQGKESSSAGERATTRGDKVTHA